MTVGNGLKVKELAIADSNPGDNLATCAADGVPFPSAVRCSSLEPAHGPKAAKRNDNSIIYKCLPWGGDRAALSEVFLAAHGLAHGL